MNNNPIGIFDSGLGGLTVVKSIKKIIPNESIIYFGDTARVPYGNKSINKIIEYSIQNTKFLLSHNVKTIVVACNSSTAAALKHLKKICDIPIIGVIEPGAVKAVELTKNHKIGVIGTRATINSESYTNHIQLLNSDINVYSVACPLFVPIVEEGWENKEIADNIICEYLEPLKTANIDTLILGCTHYPMLNQKISDFFNNKINIVDSGQSCSEKVKSILENKSLLNSSDNSVKYTYFVSDTPSKFSEIGSRFLSSEFNAIKVV